MGIIGPVTEFTTLDRDGERIAANDHVEHPDCVFHGPRPCQKGRVEYRDRFTVASARDGGTVPISRGSGIRHGVEDAARADSVPMRRTTLPA
ncbi:hypothetical protein ACIGNX_22270 [Actinosynnema sp. NPDC053489]|uniref:hypothetical protein n=1 Tax=Actinosynnema sp. NPDC053489 TaxID=3363916 RepID=UPI0037CB3389